MPGETSSRRGYMRHVEDLNSHDLSGFVPWSVGSTRVGWVRHALAGTLLGWADLFSRLDDGSLRLTDRDPVDTALDGAVDRLVEAGVMARRHGERYPVLGHWGAPLLGSLDRSAVPFFGTLARGLHLNGAVRGTDGVVAMWIGVRPLRLRVAPGKLDNLVAGGQPVGLSLADNLAKECAEEAGIGPDLAAKAAAAGTITYCWETAAGLRRDLIHVYDLWLDPDFTPVNADGEVAEFRLMPIEQVAATVRDTDDFKFNCNLVVIDWLLRHGFIDPDAEPDYLALSRGLRAPWP